ncbi:peptidylprolyl isomerase [Strigomonas culicis]|uniref:Peptidylprolyl isomerase n=1 Tax=Strigomonas culicis TaxID=28005 RepID=S9VX92_9TRYP|nr:peptidylprolyl isomerase [Strigomonas culicis]|eukprot:EPY31616.1 peptidylprolyl isomerase [Strigomonas culicis]
MQICAPSNLEKNKVKTATFKNCPFKRLTKIGLQIGESSGTPNKVTASAEVEAEVGKAPHAYGTLSLCRSVSSFEPSHFFICLTNDPSELDFLNKKYVVFGQLVEGLETVGNLRNSLLPYVGENGVLVSDCPITIADITQTGEM